MSKEVRVTWEDITTYHGTFKSEDFSGLKPMLKRTYGEFIREDKKYIHISSETTEDATFREVTVIPKANIRRIYVYPKSKRDKKDW